MYNSVSTKQFTKISKYRIMKDVIAKIATRIILLASYNAVGSKRAKI